MAAATSRVCYRELFKNFNILLLASDILLIFLPFLVDNMEKFQTNSDIYSIRYRYNLRVLNTNLQHRPGESMRLLLGCKTREFPLHRDHSKLNY
jgi:hypothetical protein